MRPLTHRALAACAATACLAPLFCGALAAAAPKSKPASTKPAKDEYTAAMDYGPFLSTSVSRPAGKSYKTISSDQPEAAPTIGTRLPGDPKHPIDPVPDGIAQKGIVIPVGRGTGGAAQATVCFDTDTLRMAGGWTGGWLDLSGTMLTNHKGTSHVTLAGTEQFHCDGLGWGTGGDGAHNAIDNFVDRRDGSMGPIPAEQGRYTGLYVNGDRVVLSYRVAKTDVLESPGFDPAIGAFTRTVRREKSTDSLWMAVCDVPGAVGEVTEGGGIATLTVGEDVTAALVVSTPAFSGLQIDGGRLMLKLAPAPQSEVFTVALAKGARADLPKLITRLKATRRGEDPKELCTPGPARWKPVHTSGQLDTGGASAKGATAPRDAAYVADTLTTPDDNPYHSWMRLTGLDFFPDGRAAVCTLNGDVWIVSGINDKLDKLTWTRFATGLYHPMGLRIVDNVIYVRGRDQITKLHDLNGDGEADFYENFNNEGFTHPSYHGFAFDLQTDPAGNFYYARGGIGMSSDLPGEGRMVKVSKDGSSATVVATGLRAPNGLGGGPAGWVAVSDNQGNWIPSSKIHFIDPTKPPEFLGFLPAHHMDKVPAEPVQPALWIPHNLDPSSGGQAYVDSDKWGPYEGQWVHTSFGTACVLLLLPDTGPRTVHVPGGGGGGGGGGNGGPGLFPPPPPQAAVVRMPLSFATGVMRPRFNPADGQLYLCGVGGGWQTSGTRDGALYRVRYTGKPAHLPNAFHVVPGGVELSFPTPLDRKSAADEQNWAAEAWNYKWSEKYGSPDLSAKNPAKAGHDTWDVKAAKVSEDGKTVTLEIPDLTPVMQLLIQVNVKAADGTPIEADVYGTVNAVPAKGAAGP